MLLAAFAGTPAAADAHTTKGDRTVRVDRGIGPVDLGDRYRDVRRLLGRGRRQSWPGGKAVLVTYGKLTAWFKVRRDGRLRPGSRVAKVSTMAAAYELPDGTSTSTSFADARAALGWRALDCRPDGFAALWHRGKRASTLFFYVGRDITILSVDARPVAYEPPCSDHVATGDFE